MSRCRDGVLEGKEVLGCRERIDELFEQCRGLDSRYFHQRIRDIYLEGFL